jgi:putative endopeptidase
MHKSTLFASLFAVGMSMQTAAQDGKGFPLSNLDRTVDPCDNFYQFAAGGWMEKNPIPSTESRWGSFNILAKQNDEKIRIILEEVSKLKSDKGSPEQLVGDFYAAAMDTITLEKLGAKPLQPVLAKINGLQNQKQLAKLSADLRKMGVGGLFSFYVTLDAKESSINRVHLGQGSLGLPDRDYYLKSDAESEKIRQEYVKHIDAMFKLAGVKDAEAGKRILTFETELARFSMSRVERRDPDKTYNKYSIDAFYSDKALQAYDWKTYFTGITSTSFNHIILTQPDYLKKMADLLSKTSIADLQTYYRWQAINGASSLLNSAIETESFRFYRTVLSGTKVMKPRWERSVDLTNSYLGETLGQIFVKRHFSPQSKERVSLMVENLRTAFAMRIEALPWMSDATKKQAMIKLQAFTYKIGYPEKWKDYSKVVINRTSLYQNAMNVGQKSLALMLEKIEKPVDPTEWGMTPQTVNAYYSPSRNEIVFPAGILQPPFFDPKADDAVNYGGIGAVIGHEFSHGFDDKGSKFDAQGNLKNWWTEEDRARFDERTQKLVEQYNGFQVLDSVYVNGSLTLGENIADLAGLTMAYYALEAHLKKTGTPEPIDGFNWQQRFFLGWAHVWSQNITDKELRRRILTDSHSPGKERVLGPLRNMPEFWNAWGCSPGRGMVAEENDRVILW